MSRRKALLIIDMQKGSFTPETPRFDTTGVVERINALAETFRARRLPVVFIQHTGTKMNEFLPNTEEWELLDDLQVAPTDLVIEKSANDSFYASNLQKRLSEHGATELVMTGCATDFCVESTIQSALAKDYHVTIAKDGHTTGARPHMEAERVIEHYNWVWRNMIPTRGEVTVESSAMIINALAR